jgi:hypothetical protein
MHHVTPYFKNHETGMVNIWLESSDHDHAVDAAAPKIHRRPGCTQN